VVLGYAAAAANYAAQLPDCRVLLFKGRATPLILVDESTHRPAIGIFAMYDNWVVNLTVVTAAVGAVALCVLVHYEGLLLTSRGLQFMGGPQRIKVLYGIFSMLVLHVIEIWIFGVTIWLLLHWPECGHIVSSNAKELGVLSLLDSVYLSAITYTTVGFGDVVPVGPIRFLSGMEALTGFVMIGWTASFTYLEMERFWRIR
jgi:hypothetical protein